MNALPADFWRLWFVGMVISTVRWLETVAVAIVVYQQTNSAFLVAVITMLRLLPMALFGAFLGAFAERFDRRLTLAILIGLMARHLGHAQPPRLARPARDLAARSRRLRQRLRLGDRQSATPHDDG